jgi:hypothetical protein
MLLRIASGVGLLALGYHVGREKGRAESLQRDLDLDPRPDEPGVYPKSGSPGTDHAATQEPPETRRYHRDQARQRTR